MNNDRYIRLKRNLNEIHNRMRNLRDNHSALKSVLSESMLFNDSIPEKDKLYGIRDSIVSIDETLVYSVIPKVSSKIK